MGLLACSCSPECCLCAFPQVSVPTKCFETSMEHSHPSHLSSVILTWIKTPQKKPLVMPKGFILWHSPCWSASGQDVAALKPSLGGCKSAWDRFIRAETSQELTVGKDKHAVIPHIQKFLTSANFWIQQKLGTNSFSQRNIISSQHRVGIFPLKKAGLPSSWQVWSQKPSVWQKPLGKSWMLMSYQSSARKWICSDLYRWEI